MKKITKKTYLDWYENMLFWRKFEDKLAQVYINQKVRGFLHLYNGQEAVLAGALHAMDLTKDKMITAYRNHVQPIGMGVDPKRVMAELYGKATGTSQGLGGSMHIFSKEHRFYGGHGIVGGQIPLGAGIAFGDKYHDRDAVTLCYMGDGAVRQGSLHETFNLAMLWNLPVVHWGRCSSARLWGRPLVIFAGTSEILCFRLPLFWELQRLGPTVAAGSTRCPVPCWGGSSRLSTLLPILGVCLTI